MLSPDSRTRSWLDRHNAAIVHLVSLSPTIIEALKAKVHMLLGDAATFAVGLDSFDISLTTGGFQIPAMAIDDNDSDDKIHAVVAGQIETFMKGFNRGAMAGERARGDGRDGTFVEPTPITISTPDTVVPFKMTVHRIRLPPSVSLSATAPQSSTSQPCRPTSPNTVLPSAPPVRSPAPPARSQ